MFVLPRIFSQALERLISKGKFVPCNDRSHNHSLTGRLRVKSVMLLRQRQLTKRRRWKRKHNIFRETERLKTKSSFIFPPSIYTRQERKEGWDNEHSENWNLTRNPTRMRQFVAAELCEVLNDILAGERERQWVRRLLRFQLWSGKIRIQLSSLPGKIVSTNSPSPTAFVFAEGISFVAVSLLVAWAFDCVIFPSMFSSFVRLINGTTRAEEKELFLWHFYTSENLEYFPQREPNDKRANLWRRDKKLENLDVYHHFSLETFVYKNNFSLLTGFLDQKTGFTYFNDGPLVVYEWPKISGKYEWLAGCTYCFVTSPSFPPSPYLRWIYCCRADFNLNPLSVTGDKISWLG